MGYVDRPLRQESFGTRSDPCRRRNIFGLAIPRFLARLPYGIDTEPLESFSFEEFTGAPAHDGYLWANAAFTCGLLLAQSYKEFGWDMGGER